MEKLRAIIFASFIPITTYADNAAICSYVDKCRQNYAENNCEQFASITETRKHLVACTEDEAKEGYAEQQAADFSKLCASSTAQAGLDTIHGLINLPEQYLRSMNKGTEAHYIAKDICEERFKKTPNKTGGFQACIADEYAKIIDLYRK